MLRNPIAATWWLMLAVARLANADCECGYSVEGSDEVYTELLENDFLHTKGDNLTEFGWHVQEYNVSQKAALGPYGKSMQVDNINLNPLKHASEWSGDSHDGGDAGLKLWVRGNHSDGLVPSAEVVSVRDDMLYGSYRVGMKMSSVNGTCGGFFWFKNDSMEIDMEFLSKDFEKTAGAVNLVLQSPQSSKSHDASNTSTYKVEPLPFSPDEHFHEYRFDWTRNKVVFYVDGERKYEMTENIPMESGPLLLNHWSNGNKFWSAGPPTEDTSMTISYVKAYFNSTENAHASSYQKRCKKFDATKVCTIPAQKVAPDGANAKTYFFSQDTTNKAPGQETFHTTNAASSVFGSSTILLALVIAIATCISSL